jgi:hypothetical protein
MGQRPHPGDAKALDAGAGVSDDNNVGLFHVCAACTQAGVRGRVAEGTMVHNLEGTNHRSERSGARVLVLAISGLLGLGVLSAGGCEGAGEPEAPMAGEPVAEAPQAVGPETCVEIRRAGKLKASDATLSAEKASTNFGQSSFALVGASSTAVPSKFRTLLKFDTTTIPANAVVTSAKIVLSQINNGAATVKLHLATTPWDEGTVTWNSFGNAFVPSSFASFSNAGSPVQINVLAQAQGWVNGSIPNHGVLVEQDGSTFQTKIRSQEFLVEAQRPRLQICYQSGGCPQGMGDCNNDPADGCETDLTTTQNCGACGNACSLPHAVEACSGGTCTVASCSTSWGDCDGDPQNGCEANIDLHFGSTNCGGCGHSCPDCGGFAGVTCGAGLTCVDFPDACNWWSGGSDCGGVCTPTPTQAGVCPQMCRPDDPAMGCPEGLFCMYSMFNIGNIPVDLGCSGPECLFLCLPPSPCNANIPTSCGNDMLVCVDDPTDACDPAVSPNCPGRCYDFWEPGENGVLCGGAAHLGCDPGFVCQDIPCDGCDPEGGGVDCVGACAPAP